MNHSNKKFEEFSYLTNIFNKKIHKAINRIVIYVIAYLVLISIFVLFKIVMTDIEFPDIFNSNFNIFAGTLLIILLIGICYRIMNIIGAKSKLKNINLIDKYGKYNIVTIENYEANQQTRFGKLGRLIETFFYIEMFGKIEINGQSQSVIIHNHNKNISSQIMYFSLGFCYLTKVYNNKIIVTNILTNKESIQTLKDTEEIKENFSGYRVEFLGEIM